MFPYLFFGVVILFVVGGIAGSMFFERRRREKLAAIATELGLQFDPGKNSPRSVGLARCKLFSRGRSRRVYNMMHGPIEDVDMKLFDYRYTTGSGKNSSTHTQTVAAFTFPNRSLPAFELHPEHFFHRIGAALGFDDIDFESHPRFSKRFHLSGAQESAVREFFTEPLLDFFEQRADDRWCVEGFGDCLIVYRSSKREKPENWRRFMNDAFEMMNELTTA